MTTGHKITAALAGALLLFAILFGYGWFREHDAAISSSEQFKGIQARIDDYRQREKQNQEQLAAALKSLDGLKTSVRTPQQIVQAAPKVITLPSPVREVTVEQAQASAMVPDAPKAGDLIIPAESAKAWFDAQVVCKQNEAKVASCSQSLQNDKAIIAAKDEQIATQQVALKGGTKWQRFGKAVKITTCAGGGGAAGAFEGVKGAAIGAAAGALLCQLF